jgi:hypothetical protein
MDNDENGDEYDNVAVSAVGADDLVFESEAKVPWVARGSQKIVQKHSLYMCHRTVE